MGVQRFEASAEIFDGVRLVSVCGELDIATSPQVQELLTDAAKDDAQPLVIDLTRCDFIDSTGLAALLHGTKLAQNGESPVAIVSPAGECAECWS